MEKINEMKKCWLIIALVIVSFFANAQNWTDLSLPDGGRVNKIVKVPDPSGERLFAGTSRGLYEYNSGQWDEITSDAGFNFEDDWINELYYSEGLGILYALSGRYINYSYDYGSTWQNVFPDYYDYFGILITGQNIYPNTMEEFGDGVDQFLLSGNGLGLFISFDEGISWDKLVDLDTAVNDIEVTPDNSTIFFGANNYLYSYELELGNLLNISSQISGYTYGSTDGMTVAGDTLYVGSYDGLYAYSISTQTGVLRNNDQESFALYYDASNNRILSGSYDGAISAYPISSGLRTTLQLGNTQLGNVIDFEIASGKIYAALESGNSIYSSSDDGSSWSTDYTGIRSYSPQAIASIPSTNQVFVSSDNNSLLTTSDLGTTWISLFSNWNGVEVGYNPTTGYLYHGGVYSTDLGASWSSLTNLPSFTYLPYAYSINFFGFTPTATFGYIYTGTAGQHSIIKSTDGVDFQSVDTQTHNDFWDKGFYYSSTNSSIFIIRPNGGDNSPSAPLVLRSTDDGASWTDVSPSPSSFNYYRSAITGDGAGNIYLMGYDGLYKSTDNGASWTYLDDNLQIEVASLAYYNGILIALTPYYGVYTTVNEGATWKSINGTIPEIRYAEDMDVSDTHLNILMAPDVYSLALSDISDPVSAPSDFRAVQSAPDEVLLTWTPDANATQYEIWESVNGGELSLVTDTITTTRSAIIPLGTGNGVSYMLRASNTFTSDTVTSTVVHKVLDTPIVEVSPTGFTMDDEITITYYADRSYPVDDLVGSTEVYFESGTINTDGEGWLDFIGTWRDGDPTKLMANTSGDIWEITFIPREFYNSGNYATGQLAFVLNDGPGGSGEGKDAYLADFLIPVTDYSASYTLDGDLLDDSGNGLDATFTGNVVFGTDRFGTSGVALEFDGEDGDTLKTQFLPGSNQQFSISFWLKNNLNRNTHLFDFGESYAFLYNGDILFYDGSNYSFLGPGPDELLDWNHYSFIFDGSGGISVYLNGVSVWVTSGINASYTASLSFGNPDPNADPVDGTIDEINIDSYSLTSDQVWEYYQNFHAPTGLSAIGSNSQEILVTYDLINRAGVTYDLYREDIGLIQSDVDLDFFYDTPVTNGQVYTYRVQSIDDLGYASQLSGPVQGITYDGLEAVFGMNEVPPVDEGPFFYTAEYSGDVAIGQDRFGDFAATYFDGDGDSIKTDQTFIDNAAFSISVWVNWSNVTGNPYQHIVSWYDGTLASRAYLGPAASGELRFTDNWPSTGVFIEEGKWTHLVATFDGTGTYTLYKDGQLAGSTTSATGLQFAELFIGSQGNTGEYFDGAIDDFTLFNRVITSTEVQSLYSLNNWPGTTVTTLTGEDNKVSAGATDYPFLVLEITAPDSPSEGLIDLSIDHINPDVAENLRLYQSDDATFDGLDTEIYSFPNEESLLYAEGLNIALNSTPKYFILVGDLSVDANRSGGSFEFRLDESSVVTIQDQLYTFSPISAVYDPIGVDDDLYAYYPFNGNANDESGNGADGTVVGGATLSIDRNGNAEQAYSFDGVDGQITTPLNAPPSGDFTISAWVNFQNTDVTGNKTILEFGDDNPLLGVSNGNLSVKGVVSSPNSLPQNTWTMVTVSYSDDQVTIYENGAVAVTASYSTLFTGSGLGIGFNTGDSYFEGLIDDVRIYDRGLSAELINYLYLKSRNSLVAYYPLDENANDSSYLYDNHGIINGSPITEAEDRFGTAGKAMYFGGVSDYIEVADAAQLDFENEFSIAFWINTGFSGPVLNKNIGGAGFVFDVDGSGFLNFSVQDNLGNVVSVSSTQPVNDNKWYQVVAIKSFDEVIMIVNDEPVFGSVAGLGSVASDQPMYIAGDGGTTFFEGYLDDIQIFDWGLFKNDVLELINASSSGFIYNLDRNLAFWNIGSSQAELANSMVLDTLDNSIVLTGYGVGDGLSTSYGGADLKVIKVDTETNEVLFSKGYGGSDTDYGWDVAPTADGGYLVTGYTSSTDGDFISNGGRDIAVIRLYADGTKAWSRTIGGTFYDTGRGVAELDDGTIAIVGTTASDDGDFTGSLGERDIFFVRLSADGSLILSSYRYGGTSREEVWNMTKTSDGNIVVAAQTYSVDGDINSANTYGESDGWVVKLNASDGSIMWQTHIGGSDYDEVDGVIEDDDGNIIVSGYSYSFGTSAEGNITTNYGDGDAFMAKLSGTDGLVFWVKNYGGSGRDLGDNLSVTSDGYVLTGYTNSGDQDFAGENSDSNQQFLIKTDFDGNIVYSYSYGGPGPDGSNDVAVASDSRIYTVGYQEDAGGDLTVSNGGIDILITNHFSDQADLVSFSLPEQSGPASIDFVTNTIDVNTVVGTDLASLIPTFEISPLASVNINGLEVESGITTIDLSATSTLDVVAENNKVTSSFTLNVTKTLSDENDILTFEVDGLIDPANINIDNHTVTATVSTTIDISSLAPVITVSPDAVIDPASGVARNFTGTTGTGGVPLEYTVTSSSGMGQLWTVAIGTGISDQANIESFTFNEQVASAIITDNGTGGTIDIEVVPSSDLTSLIPTISLSAGATISPAPGVAQDFSSTVVYTVTAEDGTTTKDWTVNVTRQQSSEAEIVDFSIPGMISSTLVINSTDATLTVAASTSQDITAVFPSYTLSNYATSNYDGVSPVDFTNPVIVTITAEDGTTRDWTITVTKQASPDANIIAFTFDEIYGEAVIDNSTLSVSAEAVYGTDLTSLTNPGVERSVGSQITSPTSIPTDFSLPISVTIVSEDGSTINTWTITVTVGPNTETEILDFTFGILNESISIDNVTSTISGEVPYGIGYPNLTPTITLSDQATVTPNSGIAQDFTSDVIYTVTAGSGDSQDWTVSISEAPGVDADIIGFEVTVESTPYQGVITPSELVVEILLPNTTDLSNLDPVVTVSGGATYSPTGPQNFNNPVEYTVLSGDGNTESTWTVYARLADGSGGVGSSNFGSVQAPSTYTKGEEGFDASAEVADGTFENVNVYARNIEDPDFGSGPIGTAFVNEFGAYVYHFNDGDVNNIGLQYYFEGEYTFAGNPAVAVSDTMTTYIVSAPEDNTNFIDYDSPGVSVSNYSIISFPFEDPEITQFVNSLPQQKDSEWRLAKWTGNDYSYYSSFNSLDPGVGYFFISRNHANIFLGGQTVNLMNNAFVMNLQSGWNLIGNPFLHRLDWSEVIRHNTENGIIASGDINDDGNGLKIFHGGFSNSSSIDAYEGAFIFVNPSGGIVDFEIPTSAMITSGGRTGENARQTVNLDETEWTTNFYLESSEIIYKVAGIGIKTEAKDDQDRLDLTHLPAFDSYLLMDIEGVARNYKAPEDFKKWTFTIPNNISSKSIKLMWDDLASAYNTLILVDGASKQIIDLSVESSVELANVQGVEHTIYYGNKADIYARMDLEFMAFQNVYPNPVQNDLNVEFYSPQFGVISYELLSIDGKTGFVDNMVVSKGINRLTIEDAGNQLSDGVYFLKMEGFDNQAVMTKFIVR